jgi:hypothetical protein
MTICESSALASFLTDLEPKQEGSRTIRKQQSGMSGLELGPTIPAEGIPHDEEPDSKD